MKLLHFAVALTFVLIGVTFYIAWQAHLEARGARQELELFRQQANEQVAAGAVAAPSLLESPTPAPTTGHAGAPELQHSQVPGPTPPPPSTEGLPSLPPAATASAPEAPAPMTAQQRTVLALPAIAQVDAVVTDQGFVVISAGAQQNLTTGMRFDLRRGAAIVGSIRIGETIEATESIADILPGSIPPGITLQEGDEVVQSVGS